MRCNILTDNVHSATNKTIIIKSAELSGGSVTFSLGGAVCGHGFGLGAFNRNNYRFPTTNHTTQVFGSDA